MDEPTRTYRHLACGGETVVSGETLRGLATPFVGPFLASCAACGKLDRTSEFVWTHTHETIDQAQERIRQGLPWPLRLGMSVTFLVVLNLLGVGAGVAVGIWDRWWTGILAGIGSLVVLFYLNLGTMDRLALRNRIQFERLL